ncbi:MAG: DUF3987 domain-containing protein, partial [Actinobacteria bacterium]|nr:DUF3987 domain-containing protein [Actinomycetota bacterium]
MEELILNRFRIAFFDQTLPEIEDEKLAQLAMKRSDIKGTDPDDEIKKAKAEYKRKGTILFAFSKATDVAIKQTWEKLNLAQVGSINLEIDEIGRNLNGVTDALTIMLELFDKGKIKPNLIKNTSDNQNSEDMIGSNPANLLMFGAPVALFDGGSIEDVFRQYMETGGARRSFFGFCRKATQNLDITGEQVFDLLTDASKNKYLEDLSLRFEALADILNFEKLIDVPRELSIELLDYKIHCEKLAADMPEHEEVSKAEVSHRYFKALKLAGTYAFLEECSEVKQEHIHAAIRMAEESGIAYNKIKTRDPAHVKLAKFIADVGYDLTYPQIADALPFFKGSKAAKEEMLTYATAWGYKNNV